MSKILVTGSSGYIGNMCTKVLRAVGHTVVEFDLANDPFQSLLDIQEIWNVMEGIDAVFHFAALASVPESIEKPLDYYDTNVTGTLNLLKVMLAKSVKRIIFSSTAAVYPWCNVKIPESIDPDPATPYGESKAMAEQIIVDTARASNLEYTIFRYFNVAGADGFDGENRKNETHLIPCILKAALQDKPFQIFGTKHNTVDGTCVRDYVHVVDVVEAHLLAFEQRCSIGKIYNIGSGVGYSVRDIIRECQNFAPHLIVEEKDGRPGDPPYLVADCSKANTHLGWRPHFDLKSIVQTSWLYHKRRHEIPV